MFYLEVGYFEKMYESNIGNIKNIDSNITRQ